VSPLTPAVTARSTATSYWEHKSSRSPTRSNEQDSRRQLHTNNSLSTANISKVSSSSTSSSTRSSAKSSPTSSSSTTSSSHGGGAGIGQDIESDDDADGKRSDNSNNGDSIELDNSDHTPPDSSYN
jgi:hypothetical protein